MNEDQKKLIEHYKIHQEKGLKADEIFALSLKEGHSLMNSIGIVARLFELSLTDARNISFEYVDKRNLTRKFDYYEVVKVISERNEILTINNCEGYVETANHDPVKDEWTYGIFIPAGKGKIWKVCENELGATGRKKIK